ncbi:MAG: hypothetical protein KJN72_12260 [Woeseia sp.]|nr:hypothetical protein [Woeseia sp.]
MNNYISEETCIQFLNELCETGAEAKAGLCRLNAARAFIERSQIDVNKDWMYLDITGALIASADFMDGGSRVMRLALDIRRLQQLAKDARQEIAA